MRFEYFFVFVLALVGTGIFLHTNQTISGYVAEEEIPDGNIVRIYEDEIIPETIIIEPGENVTWQAMQGRHRISEISGSFSSSIMGPGDTYTVIFDLPGAYYYVDHFAKKYGEVIVQ